MADEHVQRQSEFGARKPFRPVSDTRGIFVMAILTALLAGVLLFFIQPEFIFGPIILFLLVALIFKYPVLGLYLYMFIVYLRPQDLFGFMVVLRPNIALLALTTVSLVIHRRIGGRLFYARQHGIKSGPDFKFPGLDLLDPHRYSLLPVNLFQVLGFLFIHAAAGKSRHQD